MNLFSYFRTEQIERIRFLLRPERARSRGCIYGFLKFFLSLVALSLPLNIMVYTLQFLEMSISEHLYYGLSVIIVLIALPLIILAPIIAVDTLEKMWRRREDKNEDSKALELEDLLKVYRDSIAKQEYNKQEINYILKHAAPDKPLANQLEKLSARQLILIEDSILYLHETNLIPNAFPYGLRLIYFGLIALFFMGFGTTYNLIQPVVGDIFGAQKSPYVMFFLLMPIAMLVVWRVLKDVSNLWERLGATLRFFIRLLLYYWPATIIIIMIINIISKEWIAV
jgi:hypothetical protein